MCVCIYICIYIYVYIYIYIYIYSDLQIYLKPTDQPNELKKKKNRSMHFS